MYCYKQKSQKSIEEMTALLAHEVKNPLSLIKANIEFLELDKSLCSYKENINVIKKEINKITDIVSDFIFLCKPTDTKSLGRVSVFEILREIVDDFSVSMEKKNINFTLNCLCDLSETFIVSDYSKIYILFLNVYKNALEAMDFYGDINTNIYNENGHIFIDIIDSGSGIKDSIKNFITKPFFTSKPYGSGLGLYICESIATEFNGEFKLFNNSSKGCTARISFNLNK